MSRAKRNTRTLYMHTLNGMPAQYTRGGQVSFAPRTITRFAYSLKQIRLEQKASENWRAKKGYREQFRHGHAMIRLAPEDLSAHTEEGE